MNLRQKQKTEYVPATEVGTTFERYVLTDLGRKVLIEALTAEEYEQVRDLFPQNYPINADIVAQALNQFNREQ